MAILNINAKNPLTPEAAQTRLAKLIPELAARHRQYIVRYSYKWYETTCAFTLTATAKGMQIPIAGILFVDSRVVGVSADVPVLAFAFKREIEYMFNEQIARLLA